MKLGFGFERRLDLLARVGVLLAALLFILCFGALGSGDLVFHEDFDTSSHWNWRGTHSVEFDPVTGTRCLHLSTPTGGQARAIAGPLRLPEGGTYVLGWKCRTQDVSRPVAISLRVGERVLVEFENAIQGCTSGWTEHKIVFYVLPGEEKLAIVLTLPQAGEVWFDDFELHFDPDFFSPPREITDGAALIEKSEWGEIFSVYPMRKVFPDDVFSETLPTVDALRLSAAANEIEEIEIVLRPAADQSKVSFELSPLSGPVEIPSDCVSWRVIDLVDLPAEALRSCYGRAGLNPDPLLSVDSFTAPSERNTVVLLQVRVPPRTPAGLYRGEVTIRAGSEIHLSVELRVWSFELPNRPTLISEASFRIRTNSLGWEEDAAEIVDDLLAHGHIPQRIVAIELGTIDWLSLERTHVIIDFDAFDRVVEKWLARGVSRFVLPPVGLRRRTPWGAHLALWLGLTPLTPEFNQAFSDYLNQMQEHLIERGWLDRAHLYLWDEPSEQEVPQFKEILSLAKQAAPGIETAVAGSNLPNPNLYGLIDVWMPNLRRQILCPEDWACIKERQEKGETVGAYGNNRYALDMPLSWVRLWPWTLFEHGVTSTGWWSVNSFTKDPWSPSIPRLGSGYFLYPDPACVGVLDSLRWEALTAGMEDYEYFALLEEKTEVVRKALRGEEVFSGAALVRSFISALLWGTTETELLDDPSLLSKIREAIASEIETAAEPPLILAVLSADTPDSGSLTILAEPGTQVLMNGALVELESGRYCGGVTRLPGERYIGITATKNGHSKRLFRFWPRAG